MDVSGDAIFAGAFTTLGAVQFSSTLTAAAVANFGAVLFFPFGGPARGRIGG
jgi:hypothetical protein